MEGKEIKIEFIIDGKHESAQYSISEILEMNPEDVIESMESCNCQFNESNNHCEGDCLRFENSEITGFNVIDPETATLYSELEKANQQLEIGANQYALVVVELEKARELLKKVIECRGLIYSAPFLEEDIDNFLNA